MKIHDILDNHVAALVEYYDNTPACDHANRIAEEVKHLLGSDAPVYRVDVTDDAKERSLVHLTVIPTIIIYRNHREEWRIERDFPTAQALADRLTASLHAPGATNPLKGHPRSNHSK